MHISLFRPKLSNFPLQLKQTSLYEGGFNYRAVQINKKELVLVYFSVAI